MPLQACVPDGLIELWKPNMNPAFSVDAGCPVFLYEFQHTPSSFAKFKPAWVKADHSSENAFVFGGPFLTDESSLQGKNRHLIPRLPGSKMIFGEQMSPVSTRYLWAWSKPHLTLNQICSSYQPSQRPQRKRSS